MKYDFPIYYWSNKSTKVQFEIFNKIPNGAKITSCMVFVTKNNSLLMSRPERGWGLPGGHVEKDETPEECAKREVLEETSIKIKDLQIIGGWKAEKIKHNHLNEKYPDVSYQLLFTAKPDKILKFQSNHETLERKFIPFKDVEKHHHDFAKFSKIFKYAQSIHQTSALDGS